MAIAKIPPSSSLEDEQFIQIEGPNGITTGYQYDAQQKALYFKESQVLFPSFHGQSHIAEDPIPYATCDSPGLMNSDDKCKLDAILQTRVGVLGFQGAGFPDDGGWMQGDIILAAGTEFISIERIGNVVRFTVDSPIPLNCACEECSQIYWVQDETDVLAVRPPVCGGRLPGANVYGEMKVYLFPESIIVDPNDPSLSLNNKDQYPTFIFKRYDDTIIPGAAETEMILKRDSTNSAVTEIGWAMTPGAMGVPEMVWFMGKDNDGGQIRFDLNSESNPGLLGSILYKGHLITKKMGVITDYAATILSTNQYVVREWNTDTKKAIGNSFNATNVWRYSNPENPSSGTNAQKLILDSTIDLLPIGTLVDLWQFKVGEVSGESIYRRYFSLKPALNPNNMWIWAGNTQFGDTLTAREELPPSDGSEDKVSSMPTSSLRDFERNVWGLTGYDDPLFWYDVVEEEGTEAAVLNTQHRARIDTELPGLVVEASPNALDNYSERPVWLWNRRNFGNSITRIDLGRPDGNEFIPLDIVLRAKIDEHSEKYMRVLGSGTVNGINYVRVCGVHFQDLPPSGTIRVISQGNTNTDGISDNMIFNYSKKLMFPSTIDSQSETNQPIDNCDSIVLAGDANNNQEYPGAAGDIVELLHQEYNSPVIRLEFSFNSNTNLVELQVKVGQLDMGLPYEEDVNEDDIDDYVRGLEPGYAVSAIYSQAGTYNGIGTSPAASPTGFVVYDGGAVVGGKQSEYWNRIEIMVRDDQVWIWWNQLLIPPSSTLSSNLPTPVSINTPYFPIKVDPQDQYGKVGLRMWPGSKIRRLDIRSQLTLFSEFTYGQLEIT